SGRPAAPVPPSASGPCRPPAGARRKPGLRLVLSALWSPWVGAQVLTMSRVRRQTRRRRRRTLVALGLVVAVVGLTGAARPRAGFDRRSGRLETALLRAVRARQF